MISELKSLNTPTVTDLITALFAQLMGVMSVSHPSFLSKCLYPIFYLPMLRICRLLVQLDRDIAENGWCWAITRFNGSLVTRLELHGEESIPSQGPLMLVCNHPAALDVVILAATIQREDLKILISDIPMVRMLPHLASHCIPVYYDLSRRFETIRHTINHLQNGGAIFLFPRGNVEPDPAVSPGAMESLAGWSRSPELFLRRVPQTTTVVAVARGMLSAGWYKNPLINLWKKYEQRQKVAEIFQIASQLLTGKTPVTTPRVSFSKPLSVEDLGGVGAAQGTLLASMIEQARTLLLHL